MTRPDRTPVDPLARRRFLRAAARAGLGALALASLPPLAKELFAEEREADLIERNVWPEHWETTLAALDRSTITSDQVFFVRSHLPVPEVDAATWKLEVAGRVRTPLALTLAELRALPRVEREITLECAGNGRGLYPIASTSGTQWEYGAVGNARWAGVKLGDVLDRAGLTASAAHVWFEAADAAPFGKAPPFLRSIPIEKAKRDVLLAYDMNGVALPRRHGAPVRAIVPGWYGAASTKWLTRLRVEEAPSDNHFMAKGYRWVYPGDDPATAPSVEAMHVKSLITTPREGSTPPAGALAIAGYGWSGEAAVARVEVSTDGGKNWSEARLVEKPEAGTWVRWELKTTLAPGATLEIAARATDTAGETQPEAARVNAPGYGNNSIHRVKIHARA